MPEIIAGGAKAYKDALRQEYEEARGRLEARFQECADPLEQQAVRRQLEPTW